MKKKSKWNRMIYLAVIFALLLLLYLFLKNRNEKAEEAESGGMDVIQMDASSIVNFSFKIGDNFAEFSKDGDEWKNQEDSEFPVDQEAVETLLNDLLSFTAERKLEDVDGLSEYGLEDPSNTIRLTDESGTETEILVGSRNQSTGDYYVSLAEAPNTVYVTASDLSSILPGSVMELAESEAYPAVSSSDIVEIQVKKARGSYTLAYEEEEANWSVTGEDGISYSAEYQQVSSLASTLSGMVYSGLMDYNAEDLSVYGLDQPAAEIYIRYKEEIEEEEEDSGTSSDSSEEEEEPETVEKNFTLYVGNQDENGNYYVRTEGSGQVHRVSSESLSSALENNSVSYWSREIGYISMNNLKRVEVSYGGEIRTIERHSEEQEQEDGSTETEVTYTSGGTLLDEDKTEDFLNSASGISAQSKDPSLSASETAEITITVETESETFTVSYTPYDENFYLASDKEGRPGLVNKNSVSELIEAYQAVWF